MRITVKNIVQAIIDKVANCVPGAEHYKGRLEEGFSRPAFLYIPIFFRENKTNYFTSKKNLEIQIIYFGKLDGYGREDIDGRLDTESSLEGFLGQLHLQVGDRNLGFTYETKEVDEHLAIYLTFAFLDESVDQSYIEACEMEPAEIVEAEMKVKVKGE